MQFAPNQRKDGIAYDVGNKDFLGTTTIPLAITALAILKIRFHCVD